MRPIRARGTLLGFLTPPLRLISRRLGSSGRFGRYESRSSRVCGIHSGRGRRIDSFVLSRREERGLRTVGDAEPERACCGGLYFDLIGLPPRPEEIDAFSRPSSAIASQAVREVVDRCWPRRTMANGGAGTGSTWYGSRSNGRDDNYRLARRMAISRLGDRLVQRRQAVRSVRAGADRRRFIACRVARAAGRADHRDGLAGDDAKLIEESDKTLARMNHDRRSDRGRHAGVSGTVGELCPVSRSQVRPDPHARLLRVVGDLSEHGTAVWLRSSRFANRHRHRSGGGGADADELGPAGLEYRRQLSEKSQEFQTARSDRYRVVKQIGSLKAQLDDPAVKRESIEAEIAEKEKEVKDWDERIKQMDEGLKELKGNPPSQPGWTMAVREVAEPTDCQIYIRGESTSPGETVRGMLQVISAPDVRPIAAGQSGRLQLAEWLSSADNPLTPRVIVNRVWSHLLGSGIVATVDDFGTTGSLPSHPELLDDLAYTFVEEGWSIKRLIRTIVLSRTYQLSSRADAESLAADPDNVLLWRFHPRRLEAEPFRDAVMAIAGTLDRSPPVEPFLAQWNPFENDKITIVDPFVTPEQMEWPHRTVYLPVIREVLPEEL